jgi:hypothetical protein
MAIGRFRASFIPITVLVEIRDDLAAMLRSPGRDFSRAALEALVIEEYRAIEGAGHPCGRAVRIASTEETTGPDQRKRQFCYYYS